MENITIVKGLYHDYNVTYDERSCNTNSRRRLLQRPSALLKRSVDPETAVAASGNVAGVSGGSGSHRSSARERCKSVLWLQKREEQCLGVAGGVS